MKTMKDYSTTATYFFSVVISGVGAMSLQEWAVITGMLLGVATFVVNLYFKRQAIKILRKKGLSKEGAEKAYERINKS